MNLPYEVTAAGMLIITLIFYNYKNWLDLRKNRIFRDILLAGSIFLAVDSFVEYLAGLSLQSGNIFYCISDVVKNFFGALIFYLFLLYDLAVVRRMRVQYLWRLKLLSAMIIVVSIARAGLSVMVCLVDESAVYIHAYKTIHYIQHGLFYMHVDRIMVFADLHQDITKDRAAYFFLVPYRDYSSRYTGSNRIL